jgi:hypothetical protein
MVFLTSQLTWLDLSYNMFDGQIPSLLRNLKKLDSLRFSFNYFFGKIIDSFVNLNNSFG